MEEIHGTKNLEFGLNHLTSRKYMTCESIDKTPFSFYLVYQDLTLNRLRVQLHITALREELQYFLLQFLALLRAKTASTAVGILELSSDCHIDKDELYKKKRKTEKTTLNVFLILWSNLYMNGIIWSWRILHLNVDWCRCLQWQIFFSDFHRSFPELRTSANMTRWDVNPLECLKSLP